jgi:hypothetical protein
MYVNAYANFGTRREKCLESVHASTQELAANISAQLAQKYAMNATFRCTKINVCIEAEKPETR